MQTLPLPSVLWPETASPLPFAGKNIPFLLELLAIPEQCLGQASYPGQHSGYCNCRGVVGRGGG